MAESAKKEKIAQLLSMGEAERKLLTEEQQKAEGTKSNSLTFVKCIGGKKMARAVVPQQEGGAKSESSYKPIGYEFISAVDIVVPEMPLIAKGDPYKVGPKTEKTVKAGESFILNLKETANFLSQLEYAGIASGGDLVVTLSGTVDKDNDEEIRPCLKRVGGSIKDTGLIDPAAVESKGTGDKEGSTTYTVKPQYAAKFGIYFERKIRVATPDGVGVGKQKAQNETAKNWAAAFRKMFASEGVQA